MKTKIIVSSDSLIDYISHPYSISSMPSLIKFFDVETYFDYIDMSSEKFFLRLKYDKKFSVDIKPMELEYLQNDINIALEQYDNVLIVSSYELNYNDIFEKLKEAYQDKIDFYVTKATGYILANMVMEADKALKNGSSIDEVKNLMYSLSVDSFMLVLNPKDDIDLSVDVNEEKRVEENRKGKIYLIDNEKDIEIKNKDRDIVVALIKYYLDYLGDNTNVTPFILYSSRYSYYLKLIEEKLLIIHKRFKTIKKIPASPNMGLKYGENMIAIGFIKN